MDGLLKSGTVLTSESSNQYRVVSLLGAGGQGEVYDVECNGKHYALKWYFKHTATLEQKAILDNLISRGAPDTSFLWPQDLVFRTVGESFGYIMPLRPKNYRSIVDMMKRRAEPSFYALCRAAYNLTNGYENFTVWATAIVTSHLVISFLIRTEVKSVDTNSSRQEYDISSNCLPPSTGRI